MSSVIRPVCDRCGAINERKWDKGTSEVQSLIYCNKCTNTFEVEVVDYPVDVPEITSEQQYKKDRADWYA